MNIATVCEMHQSEKPFLLPLLGGNSPHNNDFFSLKASFFPDAKLATFISDEISLT